MTSSNQITREARFKTLIEKLNLYFKTPREKFNFYAGMALPSIAITSAVYFGLFQGRPFEDPWDITAEKGVASLILNIPLIISEIGVGVGLCATSLYQLRENKSKNLE